MNERIPRTGRPSSPMITRRTALASLAAGTAALGLGACSSDGTGSQGGSTVEYWLWDSLQKPAYEACAERFKEKTGITVNITQTGWDDYWTKLTAAFIAGTGPDAFIDHVSKFAQFVDLDVLVPLDEQEAWAGVDESSFQAGLIDLWKGEDGHQYGCPKDWDTEAVFYNRSMLADAGYTEEDVAHWDWNPDDGGSFEAMIAHLTVDRNGVRGDEEGFDKDHVAVYGLGTKDAGDGDGQTSWSPFTGSVGDWSYMDRPTWGTRYRYDDADRFQRTIDWYFGLVDKGCLNSYGTFSDVTGQDIQLGSGAVAMVVHGAWMFNTFAKLDIDVGIAATPVGPSGRNASMLNGVGDSVVKQSPRIAEACRWVAFLGTAEAQDIVASYGVVFPAIASSTEKAIEVFERTGLPVDSFTQHVKNGTGFYFPLSYFGADILAIMSPAMEAVWSERLPASSLDEANEQINLLFETSSHGRGGS